MTKESYESMVDESKSNKDLVAETLKQAEKTAAELQRVEEKFRENLKLLTATEFKLNQSIAELGVKEQELQESKDELTRTKQDLMEESVLRKAHADTEQELKTMMAEIRLDLLKSVTDNKGLHEKLERKQTIEQKNKDALQEFQNKVLQLSGELTDQIQGFGKTHSQIWVTVSRNMDEAHQEATRGVEEIQVFLNTQLDRMAKAAEAFESKKQETDEGAQAFHQGFEAVRNETLAFLQQTSEATRTIAVEGFDSLKKALAEFCSAVEGHHTTMTDGVVGLVDETTKFSENQAQQLLQALGSYQKATHAEVDFLTKENQKLREELEKQRQLGASSRQTLLTNIGGLLDEFLNDQSNALMGHFSRASTEQEASTGRLIAVNNHQQAWARDFNQERQASLKQLVDSRQAFASTGQEIKESITQQGGALYTRTDGVLEHLQETLNAHQTSIQTRVDTLSSQALEGYQCLQTRNTELADMHAQVSASTLSTLENLKGCSTNLQLGADRGYNRAVDEVRHFKFYPFLTYLFCHGNRKLNTSLCLLSKCRSDPQSVP